MAHSSWSEAVAHINEPLINGSFDWTLYLTPQADEGPKTTAELIEAFKAHYLASNQIKELTWQETWQRTFDRLPQDEPLSEAAILAVVLLTENHTRSRELACQRLQRLAEFAGVTVDLKPFQCEYSETSLTPRDLPDEKLILEWRNRIENPQWRWIYGMMAAFGLRPHECFFASLSTLEPYMFCKERPGFMWRDRCVRNG